MSWVMDMMDSQIWKLLTFPHIVRLDKNKNWQLKIHNWCSCIFDFWFILKIVGSAKELKKNSVHFSANFCEYSIV